MQSPGVVLKISGRYLLSRKKQTGTAILGVVFGISIFIFLISIIKGLNVMLQEIMLDKTPHVHVFNEIEPKNRSIIDEVNKGPDYLNIVRHIRPENESPGLKDGFEIMNVIRRDPAVMGVSGSVNSDVFYRFGPAKFNGLIVGVDIKQENKLFNIQRNIVEGNMTDLSSVHNGIIMGIGLCKKLNIKLNDRVYITTPEGRSFILNVVAIIKTGIAEVDRSQSYAAINTVQKILNKNHNYITNIKIKLYDLNNAAQVAQKYEEQFGYKAVNWEAANATLLTNFRLNDILLYCVVSTLLLVAGFGIYNILSMFTFQKMKDIAILKSIGFNSGDIKYIFLTQALIIGAVGGVTGLLAGFLMAYGFSKVPYHQEEFFNIDHFPVIFRTYFYVSGLIFSLVTTAMAGYFPSRKASKIDPVSIIRG